MKKDRSGDFKQAVLGLILCVLALFAGGCAGPPQESLLSREATCADIGQAGWEQQLCALNVTNYAPYYEATRVYLVSIGNFREIESLSGGHGIYEMLASPSRRYLAIVENAGEGHPELGVCSLKAILKEDKNPCFAGFNPYPGGIYDLKWQGDVLTFTNDGIEPLLPEIEGEYYQRYRLDAASAKLEKSGAPIPAK